MSDGPSPNQRYFAGQQAAQCGFSSMGMTDTFAAAGAMDEEARQRAGGSSYGEGTLPFPEFLAFIFCEVALLWYIRADLNTSDGFLWTIIHFCFAITLCAFPSMFGMLCFMVIYRPINALISGLGVFPGLAITLVAGILIWWWWSPATVTPAFNAFATRTAVSSTATPIDLAAMWPTSPVYAIMGKSPYQNEATTQSLRTCPAFSISCQAIVKLRPGLRIKILRRATPEDNGWYEVEVPETNGGTIHGYAPIGIKFTVQK